MSRLIPKWSRNKNGNTARHEVRYAFSDSRESGWEKATPAPDDRRMAA